MKLFIPTVGTHLTLFKAWTFKLKDDYRNVKFWKTIHNADPDHSIYYYGYDPITNMRITNPIQTSFCQTIAQKISDPITTTLPKGTTLVIEKVFIKRKYRDQDSIFFKVIDSSNVFIGRFFVSLNQINGKLNGVATLPIKYPQGKFSLVMLQGNEYDGENTSPVFTKNYLMWQKEDESESNCYNNINTFVEHYTNTRGINKLMTGNYLKINRLLYNNCYKKSFDNVESLLALAYEKNFSLFHIESFTATYNLKKNEWEKEKSSLTV